MRTNYVLVDFENVQPKNLELLIGEAFRVIVFVGSNQKNLPFDLVVAMQCLGERSKYIKISGNGKNALDFHIAFYLGELVEKDSSAYFHIISKDTGFDRLVEHLKERKIKIMRHEDIAQIPLLQLSPTSDLAEQVQAIVRNLCGRGQSKPRKEKTLFSTINSLYPAGISGSHVESLVGELKGRGYVHVKDGKVTYKLPELP